MLLASSNGTSNVAAPGQPNSTSFSAGAAAITIAEARGVQVVKTASPLSRPEPGGAFSFGVAVTNTGAVPLTISGLSDDVYGDLATQGTCTDAVGTELGTGDSYECAFPGELTGNAGTTQTDVVTVTAVDDEGGSVTDEDDAVVALTDVPPTVEVDKVALPETRVAPGGLFTFGVAIRSTSVEPVTITSLTDDVHGDLSDCGGAVGTVLDPGEELACTFEAQLTGKPGDAETDVVTVTVTDDEGSTGTAQDDATIRLVAPDEVPATTSSSTTTTRPPSPTTTARPPQLARSGADARATGSLAVALVGVGLLLTGLAGTTSSRRRSVP